MAVNLETFVKQLEDSGIVSLGKLEDFVPPKVEEDYLPFSWLDFKWAHLVHCREIFNFELELLTSFWQALLG